MGMIELKWAASKPSYVFRSIFTEAYHNIAVAAKQTMVTAADIIRTKGRADIKSSGNFSEKWLNDFKVVVYPTGDRPSAFAKVYVKHLAPNNFAGIFEQGQHVEARGLLWVPFGSGMKTPSGNNARTLSPKRAAGMWGLEYIPPMGSGRPPILARKRKSHRERMQPVFFGISEFTMEKKWHIGDIVQEQANAIPQYFDVITKSISDKSK